MNEEIRHKSVMAELDKQLEIAKQIHDWKMEELIFERESKRMHHEWDKERQRIRSAEIKRTIESKSKHQSDKDFMENYYK